MLPEAYIQSLLAAALDCMDGPLPEQLEAGAPAACAGLRPAGGSDGSGGAPAAAPAVDNATLAALLLEDEPDSATAAEAGQASAGAGALALTLGLAGGGAADELAAAQRAGSPPPDLGEMLALPPPPPPALPPGVAALPPGVAAPGGPELPPAPPLAAAGRAGDSSASLPAPASAASSQQAGSAAAGAPQAPSPGTGGPAGTGTREPGAPAAHPGTCRDFARRAAALYAAYALLEAQPRTGLHAEHPRVLLYLPPSRVRALGALAAAAVAAGVRDVAAIVRRLVRERAFVIGAVRRPPCGAPPPVAQAEQLAGYGAPGAVCEREPLVCRHALAAGRGAAPCVIRGAVGLVWVVWKASFFITFSLFTFTFISASSPLPV